MKSDTKIGIFVVLLLVGVVVVLLGREVLRNRRSAGATGETAVADGTDMPPADPIEKVDATADAVKDAVADPNAKTGEVAFDPIASPRTGDATGLEPTPGLQPIPPVVNPQPPAAPSEYVVQQGDSLERIAKQCYGKRSLWKAIADANPGVNPNKLRIGQKLAIPPAPPQAASPEALAAGGANTYVVKSGDTLEKIAKRCYGKGSLWQTIADANPGVNPSRLKIGLALNIPERPAVSENAPRTRPSASSSEPWRTPGATRLVTTARARTGG